MKKYIFLTFIILFPYIPIILSVAGVNPDYIFICIAVMFLLSAISSIAYLVCAIRNKWNAIHLSLLNMIVKLVHIPAFVMYFIMGLSGLLFVHFLAITIIVFLFDCIVISFSGAVALSAVLRTKDENKISIGYAVFFAISGFVFCADVITAVILYVIAKKSDRIELIK